LKKKKKKVKKMLMTLPVTNVVNENEEEISIPSETCLAMPLSTPVTIAEDELEDSSSNSFKPIPQECKKEQEVNKCDKNATKLEEKSRNTKSPELLKSSSLDVQRVQQNCGKALTSKWQLNGSDEIENSSFTSQTHNVLDEDLQMSSSSGESDMEDHDFLPDVDKSMIMSSIWREMRAQQKEKLLRDFNRFIANSNAKENEFEGKSNSGDSGIASPIHSPSGNVKEGSLENKGRVPRKGGLNKSRQIKSTKKYKGKNRL